MRATSELTDWSGLDARVTLPACSMRATSEPTDRSGARHSGFPSGVLHKSHKRADRSLGGLTPGNNCGLSANLRKYLLQLGELQRIKSKSTTLRQEIRVTDS